MTARQQGTAAAKAGQSIASEPAFTLRTQREAWRRGYLKERINR